MMELHYFYILHFIVLFLCMSPQSLHSQQVYLNNTVFDCSNNPSVPKGYLCNGIGIGTGSLCLFLLGYTLYQCIKKRRQRTRKEKLFRQNGGYLLQEKLSCYGNGEMAKLFAAEELQGATNNYNRSRFLGQGVFGTVYKGMLPYGTIVAVKKSKELERKTR